MKKKDILGLIRSDLQRDKKPKKKSLDDYLVGEEDQHEEVMKKKRSPEKQQQKEQKKKSLLDEQVGAIAGQDKKSKPTIQELDFGKLNKMPKIEQIKSLKREYLNLIDKIDEMSGNLDGQTQDTQEATIELSKNKKEIKTLQSFIRELAAIIPDAYDLKMQMDTTAWTVKEVEGEFTSKLSSLVTKVKFAEQAVAKDIEDIREQKRALENELYAAHQRISQLEESGHQPEVTANSVNGSLGGNTDSASSRKISNEEKVSQVPETSSNPVIEKKPVNNPASKPMPSKPSPVKPSGDTPKYVFLDVDRYLENLPENSVYVLKVVGQTGISRNAELKVHVENDDEGQKHFFSAGKYNSNELNSAVKLLKDRQIFNNYDVKLGSKGGYDFSAYDLTDIGKAIYFKLTNDYPVEPQMAQIKRDHKTLEHGYLIKESAIQFKEMGYTVYEDRENCTYKLDDGKRKVFDLIIEKDGKKAHIEVERGTHSEDDFFAAMDKIYQVTSEFYFIAPNEKILYQNTKGKVFKWITERLGGFENAKGKIKMNFATFDKVKKHHKKIWEEFQL